MFLTKNEGNTPDWKAHVCYGMLVIAVIVVDIMLTVIFIYFQRCLQAYKFTGKSGSSTLSRHVCKDIKQERKADQDATCYEYPTVEEKKRVLKTAVRMVSEDMRPYQVLNGNGFQSLVQAVSKHFAITSLHHFNN